jgi:hypothetical protein
MVFFGCGSRGPRKPLDVSRYVFAMLFLDIRPVIMQPFESYQTVSLSRNFMLATGSQSEAQHEEPNYSPSLDLILTLRRYLLAAHASRDIDRRLAIQGLHYPRRVARSLHNQSLLLGHH